MDNALFIVVLVVTALVVGTAGMSRYVGHFKIADRIQARRAALKIENASASLAFNDPLLRSLIACPSCGTAGQFDLVGATQCRCHQCGTVWDAG